MSEDKEEQSHEYLLYAEPIEMELGFSLVGLANPQRSNSLQSRIPYIRQTLALELGLHIPKFRIRDNLEIKENAYCIQIRGNLVAQGELYLDKVLAIVTMEGLQDIDGIATKDPTFGMDAFWIASEEEETAVGHGYTVVDPIVVLTTHIQETFREYADVIFDYNALDLYFQQAEQNTPFLATSCKSKTTMVFSVLRQLLQQRISIRDQQTILETIASTDETDPQRVTMHVRKNLFSLIFSSVSYKKGIHALVFGDEMVDILQKHLKTSPLSRQLASQLASAVAIQFLQCESEELILLCPPSLRSFLFSSSKIFIATLLLIFEDELPLGSVVISQGIVSLSEAKDLK